MAATRTRIRRRAVRRKTAPKVRRQAGGGAHAARQDARAEQQGESGLLIGGARDPAEKAADRIAAQVLAGGPAGHSAPTAGAVHRKCAACAGGGAACPACAGKGGSEAVEREARASPVTAPGAKAAPAAPHAARAIRSLGAGRPLAWAERAFFEPRFGRDFSGVRIHEGAAADRATRAIDARAFSFGHDIAFARGERERGGARLMAHELAHASDGAEAARRTVRRACHDGKCESCAGGTKTLDLSFLFRSAIEKKSLGRVVKDFMRSQKALRNCCLNLVGHFDLQKQIAGDKVIPKWTRRASGKHKGTIDYGQKARDTGLAEDVKKAKGVPILVVDEVKGTGGGRTVSKAFDPLFAGRTYIFFALKQTNTNCPTIAHELWHQGGGLTHDASKGGMVACTSDAVSADYCAKVRALAK